MAFDVHHGGHSGDIVYSIPYMRSLAEHFGDYLRVNIISDRPSPLPAAMRHPSGTNLMSKAAFEFLEPMLAYQDIIDSVRLLPLNQVPGGSVPLDFFRETRGLNVRSGNIPLWARKISGLEVSVEKPWINLPPVKKGHRLLLGFSVRYRNSAIDYSVLNQIQGVQIAFVGLPSEYEDFTKRHRLQNIDHLQVENALELGKVIKSSRFFLGNQSLAFSITEALKVDRALEVCEICPNVVPIGGKAHEYVFQAAFANVLIKNGFPTSPTNRRDIVPVLALDALD